MLVQLAGSTLEFPMAVAIFLPEACFGLKFLEDSLFLDWRPVSLDCIRHHPVLLNRRNRG